MKHNWIPSILVGIFALIMPVYSYAQPNTPTFPDLTGYDKTTSEIPMVLDGKDVNFQMDQYYYLDLDNLKRHFVSLLNNESGKPWLALYTEEDGERLPDGSVVTKESRLYLFENVNGKWVLVKDFSESQNFSNEFDELLKNKYKLESR